MNSSPPNARFTCKHCGIMFSKRSNWSRHESNVNVHSKPPRRRPGVLGSEGDKSQSGSSASSMSPVRNVRSPLTAPSTRRESFRLKEAGVNLNKRAEDTPLRIEPIHEAPGHNMDTNTLKITIRPRRSKRPRLSLDEPIVITDKPTLCKVKEAEPVRPAVDQPQKRHRAPNLDARNSQFKKWIRVMRLARWVPGETAPGGPNPLPRRIVRQRAREYAAMRVEPGSKVPSGTDSVYDVDWRKVLRTFCYSTDQHGERPEIEDLGESSTDSDSSLWDSD